ncbi:MAG TPA: AAA family ATPase [Thermoplasmata archaeon]|nr:AAA family ATPase [Thermoplasmata archaeon]
MSYCVVIRGPLGVGKTTVSKRLSARIAAEYISIDRILDEDGLWEAGHLSEFLRANEIAAARAEPMLAKRTPVVFDGNFYWKSQIEDLVGRFRYPHFVFTLKAPLRVCIERDARRPKPHGIEAAKEVYAKSTRFEYGIGLDATCPIPSILRKITSRLFDHPTPKRA